MMGSKYEQLHRKMWNRLAKTGGNSKFEALLWMIQEGNEVMEFTMREMEVHSYCFACLVASKRFFSLELEDQYRIIVCDLCPITWHSIPEKGSKYNDCMDEKSPFLRWYDEIEVEERKKFAKIVAEMEWNENEPA